MRRVRNLSTAFDDKWKFNLTSFKFGANDKQPGLFDQAAAELERPVAPLQEGWREPDRATPISAKPFRLERISISMPDQYFDPLPLPSADSQELQNCSWNFG